jgi:hypothetical protein
MRRFWLGDNSITINLGWFAFWMADGDYCVIHHIRKARGMKLYLFGRGFGPGCRCEELFAVPNRS